MTFTLGQTVVRRDVHRNAVWSAAPASVVELHEDGGFTTALWPGSVMLARTTWITSLTTNEDTRREGITNLAEGSWALAEWQWRSTILLSHYSPRTWFALCAFVDAASRDLAGLYVNFERPYWMSSIGFDTFDVLLDLVVHPDLSVDVKDADEFALAYEFGILDDKTCQRVKTAEVEARRVIADQGDALISSFRRLAQGLNIDEPLVLPEPRDSVLMV